MRRHARTDVEVHELAGEAGLGERDGPATRREVGVNRARTRGADLDRLVAACELELRVRDRDVLLVADVPDEHQDPPPGSTNADSAGQATTTRVPTAMSEAGRSLVRWAVRRPTAGTRTTY